MNIRCSRGFSLIEMLVAMFVSMVIGGAIITLFLGQMQFTASQNRNMVNQDNVRATMSFMADEIRSAGNGTVEPFLLTATSTALRFTADLDGDSVPDRVQYEVSGPQLIRRLYTTADGGVTWTEVATDVLLDNVAECLFTYFGANNTTNPLINDITSVQVRLRLNVGATETGLTQGKLAAQAMVVRATIRNRRL
jgi:type II secretory pathway pseudopilin PulG